MTATLHTLAPDHVALDAVRHAQDVLSIQRRAIAPFVDGAPVLVATETGLSAARDLAGPRAAAADVMAALATLQGLDPSDVPAWTDRKLAEGFFSAIRKLGGPCCFANQPTGTVWTSAAGITVPRALRGLLPRDAWAAAMDSYLIHEVAHICDQRSGMRGGRSAAGARFNRAGLRYRGQMCWGRAIVRHAEECFADAFSAAACSMLYGEGIASALFADQMVRVLSDRNAEGLEATFDMAAREPWRGIYCTAVAVGLALRHARGRTPSPSAARESARRALSGMLPPEDLMRAAEGAFPDWIDGFLPAGRIAEARRRAAALDAAPRVPFEDADIGGDPTDRLLRLAVRIDAMAAAFDADPRGVYPASADVRRAVRAAHLAWDYAVLTPRLAAAA